jgi:hypothetical protein
METPVTTSSSENRPQQAGGQHNPIFDSKVMVEVLTNFGIHITAKDLKNPSVNDQFSKNESQYSDSLF